MAASNLGANVFSLTLSTTSFQGYVFIGSGRKMIHPANLNARLSKSVMVTKTRIFRIIKNI
jgi:hypothetical protein